MGTGVVGTNGARLNRRPSVTEAPSGPPPILHLCAKRAGSFRRQRQVGGGWREIKKKRMNPA